MAGGLSRVPLGKPHRKVTDGLATPGHETSSEGRHKTRRRATPTLPIIRHAVRVIVVGAGAGEE